MQFPYCLYISITSVFHIRLDTILPNHAGTSSWWEMNPSPTIQRPDRIIVLSRMDLYFSFFDFKWMSRVLVSKSPKFSAPFLSHVSYDCSIFHIITYLFHMTYTECHIADFCFHSLGLRMLYVTASCLIVLLLSFYISCFRIHSISHSFHLY